MPKVAKIMVLEPGFDPSQSLNPEQCSELFHYRTSHSDVVLVILGQK